MKIVKPNNQGIKEAVEVLRRGGTVVYPTDTAYALGGKFNSKKVIKSILLIKNRTDEKFTLVSSSISQVRKFFKLNKTGLALAKKYWPGPLSITVSNKFSARVPANGLARSLARRVGKPLIATSTNQSGGKTLYSSTEIINQFKNKKNQPDLFLDCGRLPKKLVSTIVKVGDDKKIEVIRQGAIKAVLS